MKKIVNENGLKYLDTGIPQKKKSASQQPLSAEAEYIAMIALLPEFGFSFAVCCQPSATPSV